MNCHQVRKWLSPYLDSELDAAITFEVSQHLETCDACRWRFERETAAEHLLTAALARNADVVDWPSIERKIAPVRRRRIVALRPRWLLGMAACLAFVVLGLQYGQSTSADPAGWAIEELHRLQPECTPFEGHCTAEDLTRVAGEVLDCDVQLNFQPAEALQLVAVRRRTCPAGKPRLEIQLNCCEKPILLTVGRCRQLGELGPVDRALQQRNNQLSYCREIDRRQYHVCACRRGDVVMIAVSPDHAEHLQNLLDGVVLARR